MGAQNLKVTSCDFTQSMKACSIQYPTDRYLGLSVRSSLTLIPRPNLLYLAHKPGNFWIVTNKLIKRKAMFIYSKVKLRAKSYASFSILDFNSSSFLKNNANG